MQMTEGQTYRCQSIECGCEVKVVKGSAESRTNLRCVCGEPMKKAYVPPVLRALTPEMRVLAGHEADEN